jgi:hypothetical protein
MKKPLALLITCCCLSNLMAQQNIVKLNAFSLFLGNISLQYERSLNEKSSVCMGISFMPERGLPGFATSKDEDNRAEDFTLGGFAITPEYRYYFTGNGPKGFYVAPYFRYAKYNTSSFSFNYDRSDGTTGTVDMSGHYTTTVGGIMFGSQWLLGDKWTLDWWIAGAGFGKQEGTYDGEGTFSAQDQQDIQDEIGQIDTPGADVKVETSSTLTKVTVSPNFPAFRGFGLCVGYRF